MTSLSKFKFVNIFAIFLMTGIFAYFFIYSFANLTAEQRQGCREITIAMIGTSSIIVGYLYGSSRGSSNKDEAIAQALGTSQGGASVSNIENVNIAPAVTPEWSAKKWAKDDKVTYKGKTYMATVDIFSNGTEPDINPNWIEVL